MYSAKTAIININKYFCSFMITAGKYLFFVEHFRSTFGVFFRGKGGFNHFQELDASTKF